MAARVGGAHDPKPGGERERAAIGHGVARVDRQVHEHLGQLRAVRPYRRCRRVDHRLEPDGLADEPSQHPLAFLDYVGERHRLQVEDLAAAERE